MPEGGQWTSNDFGILGSETFSSFQNARFDTIISTLLSWNINMVRFRLNAAYYNGLSAADKLAYINMAVRWYQGITQAGMIFRPCPWDGYYAAASWPSIYTAIYPLFTDLYKAINDPLMPWETSNEPNGISSAQTLVCQKGLFQTLRGLGAEGIIVADWTDFANSSGGGYSDSDYSLLEEWDATLLGSAQHQCAFAKHNYANGASSLSSATWKSQVGSTTTHVIWETEWGNYNGSTASINSAWNVQAASLFAGLQAGMPNFAGSDAFVFYWIDPNSLTETANNTKAPDLVTKSAWAFQAAVTWAP